MGKELTTIDSGLHSAWSEHGLVTYTPGGVCGPRLQPSHQLVLLEQGSVEVWIDDREFRLAEPCVFLLVPGHREYFRFSRRRPTRHRWVHFGLGDAAATPDLSPASLPAACPLTPAIVALASMGLDGIDGATHPSPELRNRVADCLLVAFLQAVGFEGRSAPLLPEPVRLAIAHIERHWREPLDLDDLARAAHVSGPHLVRLFRKHVGQTPVRSLWEKRLRRAADLVKHSGLRVSEVAHATGFSSAAHFARAFKEFHGQSPSALRRAHWRAMDL